MIPQILPTHTPELFGLAVRHVVEILARGDVVALPTETVYGLAANALDPGAVAKIFQIKGRPLHNPVIVHVENMAMARQCAGGWPGHADALARSFWPGPLTLVLPRGPMIPPEVTAGGDTVGIRWPSHPFMRAVIEACGFPLAAPSANASNRISPTRPEHVRHSLGTRVGWVVDGGQCQVGIESTVVDLTVDPPRILRPGMIHAQALAAVTGGVQETRGGETRQPLRSPGLLSRHYAPAARMALISWKDDLELRERAATFGVNAGQIHVLAHTRIPSADLFGRVSVIPRDSEAFARALYGELHASDESGAGLILVESLPEGPEWQAIADRLRRAARE